MATIDLTQCPECGQPAEIWDRRVLCSTDGPIEHVKVHCIDEHVVFMPAEYLAQAVPARPFSPAVRSDGTHDHPAQAGQQLRLGNRPE